MLRLLLFLFLLPWWTYLPLAGGVAYLTEQTYRTTLVDEAATPDASAPAEGRAVASVEQGAAMKAMKMRGIGWLVAFGVVLFGLVTRLVKRAEAARRSPVDALAEGSVSGGSGPAMPLAGSIAPNTPLGRIAARGAPQRAAPAPARARDAVATREMAHEKAVTAEISTPAPTGEAPEPATKASGFDAPFLARLALGMAAVGMLSYAPMDGKWLMLTVVAAVILAGLWVALARAGRIGKARAGRGAGKRAGRGQRA